MNSRYLGNQSYPRLSVPKLELINILQGEESAEVKIKALDEMHQKYKFMENSLSVRYFKYFDIQL